MDESHHARLTGLLDAAEWYVRALRGPERSPVNLVLSGSSGSGKSHVARRILKFAQGYGCEIITAKVISHWATVWIDWTLAAEADEESDFAEVRRQTDDATMVVLDDVGSEADRFKNGVPGSRLRRVLTDCENRRKWLVVTTNMSQKEALEAYDVRVADRLRAFHWFELGEIPSYRPKL